MKDLTPKVDDASPDADGQYTAEEFNDLHNDVQNAVEASGQTLTATAGENNNQTLNAIAAGGRPVSRGDNETAEIGDIVFPDNVSGTVEILLPEGDQLFFGATVKFVPVPGQLYSDETLRIEPGVNTIVGAASDLILNDEASDNQILVCIYDSEGDGGNWNVLNPGKIGI